MQSTEINTTTVARAVDNTDWLKTAAIILVSVDHFGYFFIESDLWWSTFGRLAAPPFFFLLGYAQTRTVPLNWIWLGVFLTLLDSWNNDWTWVAPNILLSLALIRVARPYFQILVQRFGWAAFVIAVAVLLVAQPISTNFADYGSAGWLWALFGFYQRIHVDSSQISAVAGAAQNPVPAPVSMAGNANLIRLLACLVAAVVYIWQEQGEFQFSQVNFAAVVLGVGVLSLCLCLFVRAPSRIQPPAPMAGALRFIGRRTLEIYAILLAGFELVIKMFPDLAP